MISLESYQSGVHQRSTMGYDYFMPSHVNDQWTWDTQEVNRLLEEAALRIGGLNSYADLVPNVDLFIQLHVAKEAVVSSRIEGTQTRIDEAFMRKEEVPYERRDDWKEVSNYVEALNTGIAELDQLPISTRLIKLIHEILLSGVRGEHKLPGEYRTSQNWIGGRLLKHAIFVPPHHEHLGVLMGDLEKFMNNDRIGVPHLVVVAIAHYQFETIHPFLDGNGRIGRLLITLLLIEKKILSKPLLYLSSYFEANKRAYYDHLTQVRTHSDMTAWLKYFLIGIAETAEHASNTLATIIKLQLESERKISQSLGRKVKSGNKLLAHLFKNPVTDVRKVQAITELSYKSANGLVDDFVNIGILKEKTGQNRNRVFVFADYLDLF